MLARARKLLFQSEFHERERGSFVLQPCQFYLAYRILDLLNENNHCWRRSRKLLELPTYLNTPHFASPVVVTSHDNNAFSANRTGGDFCERG